MNGKMMMAIMKAELFKSFGDHQVVFHALLQMIRLMVEGVTPYFWASWS